MARNEGRRASRPGDLFVGREWELAQLTGALEQRPGGRGHLFLVTGEAGIGKSRLVAAVGDVAETAKARVVWGRCWEGAEAPPFWPWIQVFRTMGSAFDPGRQTTALEGRSPNLGREIRAFLEDFLGGDAAGRREPPSEQLRFQLFDRVAMFIRFAASDRPLVLVFEDLHEADMSSLLLLQFLAAQLDDLPLLILGTFREAEAGLDPAIRDILGAVARRGHRIPLAGLSVEEVAEFLEEGFGIVLSRASLEAVHRATAGNPLFLDEVARRFVAEQHLRELPGGGLEVPDALKAPIRSRTALLPPDAQSVLAAASVMGRAFSLPVVEATTALEREEALAALGKLVEARLVDPAGFGPGPRRFTHALVREIVYQELRPEERCRLHLQIAHAIERVHAPDLDAHVDALAHHFTQAAELEGPARAIDCSRRAAERATRQYGYDEAVVHYRTALGLAMGAAFPPTAIRPPPRRGRRAVVGGPCYRGDRDIPLGSRSCPQDGRAPPPR